MTYLEAVQQVLDLTNAPLPSPDALPVHPETARACIRYLAGMDRITEILLTLSRTKDGGLAAQWDTTQCPALTFITLWSPPVPKAVEEQWPWLSA